ncbi:MAG: vanadium-dependent haloperoxidase [Burkholderiales bacterium]
MPKLGKVTALMIAVTIGVHAGAQRSFAQTPNVVIQWNQILQTLFGNAPGPQLRALPMMHIAVFDAINSIEDVYSPYRVQIKSSHGASAEAAAAQAARDVLSALYPAQQATFDAALAAQLASIPQGLARQGQAIGRQAAQAVLEWRTGDGWPAVVSPDPTYLLPPFPGLWQPTPPANSFATFTFFPNVVPFAMLTSTQFLPPPPPTLTSARYTHDFNEAKELGSATSAIRTAEQTLMAEVFAGVNTTIGFFHVWNIVAGTVAQQEGLSLLDTARMFVLVNVGLHDGLQTSFTSKFVYGLWRPITAIRRADEDLNPDTNPDTTWTPLLATPPYPSYAGNAACLSAASARALQLALGRDDVPFSVTWGRTMVLPSETRHFTGFWQLADQQARSRIHGGIHYQFDSDASQAACVKVPEFTAANFMVRRER